MNMKVPVTGAHGWGTNISMKNDDPMKAAAEDLKVFCEHSSCYEYDEDEWGNESLTHVCPFLEKDEEPEDAHCILDEPYGWHLERMQI